MSTHSSRHWNHSSSWLVLAVGLALVAGAVGVVTYRVIDRRFRTELLQKVRMTALTLNLSQATALTGTEADFASPDYQRIKENLILMRGVEPRCRFLYLMSRRSDGTIILHVDSEPADSEDYSPPGQTYDEAPSELQSVFSGGQARVTGPYKDRWGNWLSAFVPLSDSQAGDMRMVFGVDIDASDWQGRVAFSVAVLTAITALTLVLGMLIIVLLRRNRSIRDQQQSLLKSEDKYRSLVDNLSTGMVVHGPDMAILFSNAAAASLLGLSEDQLSGKMAVDPRWCFLQEDGLPLSVENYPVNQVLRSGKRYHNQIFGVSRPERAEPVWLLCNAYPVKNEVGQIMQAVVTFVDITDQKRAEQSMRLDAIIMANMVAGVNLVRASDGVIIYTNPQFEKLFGYNAGEMIGQPISIVNVSDGRTSQAVAEEIMATLKKDGVWSGEIANRRKDGTLLWCSANIATFEHAEHGRVWISIHEDITEKQQAEKQAAALLEESNQAKTALLSIIEDDARSRVALQESEKSLVEAQSIACLGSYTLDIPSGRWKSSVALDEVLGIGKSYDRTLEGWLALIHPDDRAMMNGYVKDEVIGNRKPFNSEYRIIRQNDRAERWVHGLGRLEMDATDAPVKLVGTIQDITERKQAENYREISREVLQILNAPNALPDTLQRVIAVLKTRTGFDAVGLRLQDGEDFPYYAQSGFSKEFLLTENTLIAHASDGGVCRNKDGSICLECTCGLVLSGKTDPANPLFTRGGSCWTNDSFPLLDLPSDQDPRLHPRNECIHQGYASVALIPIKTPEGIVGLIHLNDRREGCFCFEMVELMEGIASHIGTAMMRKQAEAEKERLLTAINQAAEAIVITDAEGIIQYVNPAFEVVTGYSREEAIGQNPRILKSGEQNGTFYQGMWNTLLSGKTWSGRMVNRRKDGTHYTEEAKISPVKDSAGKTINYVGIKSDITAELAREEQYRQAQKMETVGQLAGGIAHDFNNILQSISGFCEILVMEMDQCIDGQPADYVAQLADVGEIHRAARHAADLTRQLLTFSRKQSTEQREIDLGAVLADGMQMLRQAVDERVKLEFQPAPEPLTVHADASQMMQIVMNLVVNARDAMPDGGKVVIAVKAVRIGPDDVAGMARSRAGEFVCLSVSDTGTGMDANRLKHVFEPFFTSKGVGEGTGLGLSVVYGIVESHHGWIDVDSTLGTGTTFRIYLPVYDGAAVNPPDVPPDGEAVVLGRILLVEDDPVVRDLTGEILQDMGYAVFAAATAREAGQLFAAENGAFDLLLIDVMLPDGNGIELAETLLEQTAGVPVLLCSGSDGPANSEWAAQKGFDYMPKPYGLRTLLDAVGKSLQERRTTKENT